MWPVFHGEGGGRDNICVRYVSKPGKQSWGRTGGGGGRGGGARHGCANPIYELMMVCLLERKFMV